MSFPVVLLVGDALSRLHAMSGGSQEACGAYSGLSPAHNDIHRVVLQMRSDN
jgi:hypothetical protein